ncbi:MAG: DNA repair protein RecO [Alphaproteobacteria bacterium]|nr:DNA repair protein RecO [Alphaproteobacteria bacterium]
MAVEWTDLGLVLSVRKHGEHDIILHILTEQHGHHAGVVKGGAGRRARGLYQPGNRLHARWRARLEDHLGTFVCEPERMFAAGALHDRMMLTAMTAVCAMAEAVLPEREAHPLAYQQACHLLETLGEANWVVDYVLWEMHLLNELGFGLDLSSCASTGVTDDLIYVSPKSGRAVSREAGGPYKGQLRVLPAFLVQEVPEQPGMDDVIAGLDLTGFFLERHVYAPHQRSLPDARQRLRALISA